MNKWGNTGLECGKNGMGLGKMGEKGAERGKMWGKWVRRGENLGKWGWNGGKWGWDWEIRDTQNSAAKQLLSVLPPNLLCTRGDISGIKTPSEQQGHSVPAVTTLSETLVPHLARRVCSGTSGCCQAGDCRSL